MLIGLTREILTYWYILTVRIGRNMLLGAAVVCSLAMPIEVDTAQSSNTIYFVSSCTELGLNTALRLAPANGTIKFKCDGTISLSSVEKITHSIKIDASDRTIILDGQGKTGLFEVAAGASLSITKLTFAHVHVGDSSLSSVHGIKNFGTVWIEQSTFLENSGPDGAAIENFGTLTIQDSYFEGNRALGEPDPHQWGSGGAISNIGGTVIVSNSTFIDNHATNGGAIYNTGALTIDQSIFTQNEAGQSEDCTWCGGAIANTDVVQNGVKVMYGLMVMRNSVVYANNEYGVINTGVATIVNSTIAQNTAALPSFTPVFSYANIANHNIMTLRGTIVAANLPNLPDDRKATYQSEYHTNCADSIGTGQGILDGGDNLQYPDSSCGRNIPVADPKLTPFGDYGFATAQGAEGRAIQTVGLQADSPAIDNGLCNGPPYAEIDARGFPRTRDGKCDIGAFQFGAVHPTPTPTSVQAASPTATAL